MIVDDLIELYSAYPDTEKERQALRGAQTFVISDNVVRTCLDLPDNVIDHALPLPYSNVNVAFSIPDVGKCICHINDLIDDYGYIFYCPSSKMLSAAVCNKYTKQWRLPNDVSKVDGEIIIQTIYFSRKLLIFSNSHSVIDRKHVAPEAKLQLSREKKGKMPLKDYHVVTLKPSIERAIKHDQETVNSVERDGKRLHWRRGHFKMVNYRGEKQLRWWQPHLAGKGELINKHYAVK